MTNAALLVELVAGGTLVTIELARSVPAWLRVRRSGSTSGLSPVSTGVLAGSGLGWIAVAVLADSWAAMVATVIWLIFHLLLWREMARADGSISRRIATSAAVTQGVLCLVAVLGVLIGRAEEALGLAIGAATVAYALPALIAGMTSASTSGLSLVSLAVNTLEGGIYLAAGSGLGGITPAGSIVLGYILFGCGAIISNAPRLVRTGVRRMRHLDDEKPPQDLVDQHLF